MKRGAEAVKAEKRIKKALKRGSSNPADSHPLVKALIEHNTQLPPSPRYYSAGTGDFILRDIPPYPYVHKSYAKGRQVNRRLLDVLTSEFKTYPRMYYKEALRDGRVTINGFPVDPEYVIKGQDVMCHLVHRHEPPVSASIRLIDSAPGWIAVDKPPCLPIHPCGSYHFNSLIHTIADLHPDLCGGGDNRNPSGLFGVHRLDRLTSGVVVIATDRPTAAVLGKEVQGRSVDKWYLARVTGRWPGSPDKTDGLVGKVHESFKNKEEVVELKMTVVDAPIAVVDIKKGSYCCGTPSERLAQRRQFDPDCSEQDDAKSALTEVCALSYDSDTDNTVVLCHPRTGRTHQIRLHLQYMGHPISNDPNYGGALDTCGASGDDDNSLMRSCTVKECQALTGSGQVITDVLGDFDKMNDWIKATCPLCAREIDVLEARESRSRGIYLHAWRYKFDCGVDVVGNVPMWAEGELEDEGKLKRVEWKDGEWVELA